MTKILLVEDDKSLREIYGVRLLAEGYDIISAGDGEEALAIAIKDRPSLIISDVMMPKISGFDMLDILRSTTETRDIRVIMMTALSSEDQRARGEQLGADRYLVKSQVGIEDVVRTVHEILGDGATTAPIPTMAPQPIATRPTPPPAAPARPAPVPQAPQRQYAIPPQALVAEPAPQAAMPMAQPVQVQQQPAYAAPAPAPMPAPVANSLPQPTAPFSTARPTGLGLADRVINPLPKSETATEDLSSRMEMELSKTKVASAPAQAGVPMPAPVGPVGPPIQPAPMQPLGSELPQMAAPATPPTPVPQPAATNSGNPFVTPVVPVDPGQMPNLNFEETPR